MKKPSKYDWTSILVYYLEKNIGWRSTNRNKPIGLKQLAEEFNVPYHTMRRKASKDKWNKKLDDGDNQVITNVIKNTARTLVETETNIRARQVQTCKECQIKAMEKLAKVKSEDLTVKQAIELLRLGLEQERRAAGLPDKFVHEIKAPTFERLSIDDAQDELKEVLSVLRDEIKTIEGIVVPDDEDTSND